MGKAKKMKMSKKEKKPPKIGLAEQIAEASAVKMKDRQKVRKRQEEDEEVVDAKSSQKILMLARQQQLEIEEEQGLRGTRVKKLTTKLGNQDSSDDEYSLSEEDEVTGNEYYEDIKIDEDDERALNMFMDHNRQPLPTLGDLIMEKLKEKKTELESHFSDSMSVAPLRELDPKIVSLYEGVRDVLSKYRSGKLPKAFKIIPTLKNWEEILYVTNPTTWSAAAMYQGTRVFASNLKEKMAQRFYCLVLLPRIRDDIFEYKRLNFHLYQALKKALFKPGAFMKGIVLPLLNSGNCTLREAIIVGSVVTKCSIPMLHSAAAMLKIAEMDYTGANSIFLRILFDKKYALPYRVVDGVVFHFLRFERDKREMPVLWHQALLTFVQRYKTDVSSEQREALLNLLKSQKHHVITPEIRRELQFAESRDVELSEPADEVMDRFFDDC